MKRETAKSWALQKAESAKSYHLVKGQEMHFSFLKISEKKEHKLPQILVIE